MNDIAPITLLQDFDAPQSPWSSTYWGMAALLMVSAGAVLSGQGAMAASCVATMSGQVVKRTTAIVSAVASVSAASESKLKGAGSSASFCAIVTRANLFLGGKVSGAVVTLAAMAPTKVMRTPADVSIQALTWAGCALDNKGIIVNMATLGAHVVPSARFGGDADVNVDFHAALRGNVSYYGIFTAAKGKPAQVLGGKSMKSYRYVWHDSYDDEEKKKLAGAS